MPAFTDWVCHQCEFWTSHWEQYRDHNRRYHQETPMSTRLHLAVTDESERHGIWYPHNRERHMQDAEESTLLHALDHIYEREVAAAERDTVQVREVTRDEKLQMVTHHNRTARERTTWTIGAE